MLTLFVGLWKEWRDARGISIALLVALPVLAFTSALAFGDEVARPSFGGISLFVITVAQALFVLAVASESFGGERRRGTLDFVRRLPRGIGRALAAKCGAYVVGTLLAMLWGALVAWSVCATTGPERAVGDLAQLLLLPDPLTTTLALALFVLGLWTLFMSNLVPQGGAATVGAALLLGLLGVPVYLALKDRPWLLRMPSTETLRLGLAVLGAVGTCALIVAFLRGCRFLGGVWAPAWRGLSVVLVLAGGGYAWGAVALDRALTLDPSDPKFHVHEPAFVGTGGRYVFVNVYRGPGPWLPGNPDRRSGGTPLQPWIIDLTDGSWRVAGEFQQAWAPFAWNNMHVPQPIVRLHDEQDIAWFDGATGTLRKVLPFDVRTPDLQAWQRSKMPALAWHKDDEGRALWFEGDRLVREGDDVPFEKWFRGKAETWHEPLSDGWFGYRWFSEGPSKHTMSSVLVEAATGAERRFALESAHSRLFLSTRTLLRRVVTRGVPGKKPVLRPWELVDLAGGGEARPTVNPPTADSLIAALPGERALVLVGDDKDRLVLSSWDPRTGETKPILDADGEPTVGQYAYLSARAPGLRVVGVQQRNPGASSSRFTNLLLDDTLGHAWRLPEHQGYLWIMCIESPRSLVVRRGRCEIVRYTLRETSNRARAGFEAEVLFPR